MAYTSFLFLSVGLYFLSFFFFRFFLGVGGGGEEWPESLFGPMSSRVNGGRPKDLAAWRRCRSFPVATHSTLSVPGPRRTWPSEVGPSGVEGQEGCFGVLNFTYGCQCPLKGKAGIDQWIILHRLKSTSILAPSSQGLCFCRLFG